MPDKDFFERILTRLAVGEEAAMGERGLLTVKLYSWLG
jgi:hypothetical protein